MLRGKRQGRTPQRAPKENYFIILWLLLPPNPRRSTTKAFSKVSLVSLTLRAALCFKIFEKMQAILLFQKCLFQRLRVNNFKKLKKILTIKNPMQQVLFHFISSMDSVKIFN